MSKIDDLTQAEKDFLFGCFSLGNSVLRQSPNTAALCNPKAFLAVKLAFADISGRTLEEMAAAVHSDNLMQMVDEDLVKLNSSIQNIVEAFK